MDMLDLSNHSEVKKYADEQGIPIDAFYEMNLQHMNMLIEQIPDNPKYFMNRAFDYYELHNYEAAIDDYLKSIELSPNNPKVYLYLGACYSHLNQEEKAIESYNKALEFKDYTELNGVYRNLALSFMKLKDFDKALESINKAIEIMPEYIGAYYKLRSNIYYELEDYENSDNDWDTYESNWITRLVQDFENKSFKEKLDIIIGTFGSLSDEEQNTFLAEMFFKYKINPKC